jgi:hypothetical protein
MKAILSAAAVLAVSGSAVLAGPIQTACNRSDRAAASPSMCACIQQAADMTLRSADQRRAAKFFADPDEAHRVRFSQSDRDDAFWERYRAFGETAEAVCAG